MVSYDCAADRVQALDFYNLGVPSCLPDENRFKGLVEDHRWGRHGGPDYSCPVCERAISGASQ